MLEENIFQAETVTYNHIMKAENRAREVTAVGAAKHLYQVFVAFEVTDQLVHQLSVLHKASKPDMKETCHSQDESKLRAN